MQLQRLRGSVKYDAGFGAGMHFGTCRSLPLSIARATAAQFQTYVFDINGLAQGGTGRSCVVDPAGTVLYQAAGDREIIPIEIDLEQVRRQRAMGLRGLGQVLKSFRDREVEFTVYDRDTGQDSYLQTLGPLAMPARGGSAGLARRTPASRGSRGARDQAKEADAHINRTTGPTARF